MPDYPSRVAEKIVVRLPDGMRDELASMAKSNTRSANAEVVAALTAWIETNGRLAVDHKSIMIAEAIVTRLKEDPKFLSAIQRLGDPEDSN